MPRLLFALGLLLTKKMVQYFTQHILYKKISQKEYNYSNRSYLCQNNCIYTYFSSLLKIDQL